MSVQSETIQISGLEPGTKNAIERIAARAGKDSDEWLRTLVEAEILSYRALSEILEPIRREFRESGMTDDDLDILVDEARENIAGQSKQERE